jgi:FkbM family methyltransferase
MSTNRSFVSYAQNGEDVILNRVLGGVENGHYIDVGANHPRTDSVSRSFYERGWSGLEVDPNPAFEQLFHEQRPRDAFIHAAITDSDQTEVTFHVVEGTGLSTLIDSIGAEHAEKGRTVTDITVPALRLDAAILRANLIDTDIHFLLVDTEGAELSVLHSIDFAAYRPWILIIEATAPGKTDQKHESWEQIVLDAGYEFCLFDGLSRFYVAGERAEKMQRSLSYPVCVFDDYVKDGDLLLQQENDDLRAALAEVSGRLEQAVSDVDAIRMSTSWRVTKPLRAIGAVLHGRP